MDSLSWGTFIEQRLWVRRNADAFDLFDQYLSPRTKTAETKPKGKANNKANQ